MGRREPLIARRRHLDFTQESLAHHLNVSVSAVTSWERGTRVPSPGMRSNLAEALQVSLIDLDRLLGIEAPIELNGHKVPRWLNTYESLVQAAGALAEVEFYVLPGLLHTKAYSLAIERTSPVAPTDEQAIERVDLRLARQAVLYRETGPLALTAVIPERALHEVVGGPEVMAEQLDYLTEVAERSNIDLRILPADGRGAFAVNSFELLTKPGEIEPFMVVTLAINGPHYQEDHDVVAKFQATLDHLIAAALDPDESTRCIRDIRETYR